MGGSQQHGIIIDNPPSARPALVTITGSQVTNCGVSNANNYDAIYVHTGLSDVIITHNQFSAFPGGTSATRYAVNIETVSNGFIITNNDVWDVNGTPRINLQTSTTVQSASISGNAGYNPVGSITLPAAPLVSGTVYQNTYAVPITIYQPAYATTSGTAGTVAVAMGNDSAPSTLYTKQIGGSTSSAEPDVCTIRVPPGWYYSFTTSGTTLLDAQIQGE